MEESSSSPSSSGTSGGGETDDARPPPPPGGGGGGETDDPTTPAPADRSPSSPKGAYNPRHPSVKRILREVRELAQNADLAIFAASPLEDNLFEWLFAVSGPPAFAFLTPNGRFETGVRVCLSISQHHPEEWQPSWGVRTALTALQAFPPTPGRGAVGSLDLKPEERRKLAARSRDPGGVAELLGSAKEDKLSLAAELHRLVLEHASEAVVSSPGGRGGGGGGGRGRGRGSAGEPESAREESADGLSGAGKKSAFCGGFGGPAGGGGSRFAAPGRPPAGCRGGSVPGDPPGAGPQGGGAGGGALVVHDPSPTE